MKEKKYQVFVSSTYEDLKEERTAVYETLLSLGFIPVGMEWFPASDMSQMEYIEKMLETCDYYVLILAGRYGSVDQVDGVGYTEKEYDYAVKNKIPVVSFVVDDIKNLPSGKCEDTDEGKERLQKFRDKVSRDKMINFYSSKDELKWKVAISLIQCVKDHPATGWVRADEVDADSSLDTRLNEFMMKLDQKLSTNSERGIRYELNEAGGYTVFIDK